MVVITIRFQSILLEDHRRRNPTILLTPALAVPGARHLPERQAMATSEEKTPKNQMRRPRFTILTTTPLPLRTVVTLGRHTATTHPTHHPLQLPATRI